MTGRPPLPLPGGRTLDFSGPALIMAIVNCNEDSFYPASRALSDKAVEMALRAEKEGAAIIDFGGESTRPGSSYISEEEEISRVIPVIKAFRTASRLPVSVDTRKAAVARKALEAGADIINDISGLSDDPAMAAVCAASGAAVVIMHKKGDPRTMQESPHYGNFVREVHAWLMDAADKARAAGIPAEKIILDPGIGFGKSLDNNLEILRRLAEICGKEYPVLIGLSRKRFLGEIAGLRRAARGTEQDAARGGAELPAETFPAEKPPEERLAGTLAANGAAILGGADIIRVHDVKEHRDLAEVLFALRPEY